MPRPNTLLAKFTPGAVAVYRPYLSGKYSIKPDLHAWGSDFGNGPADRKLFQLDHQFPHYLDQKQRTRKERLDKYHCTERFGDTARRAISLFICDRLAVEHSAIFVVSYRSGRTELQCRHTGDVIALNESGDLIHSSCVNHSDTPWISSLDALACQVQEDLAVISLSDEGKDYISALHLCFPNYWSAESKIGCSFNELHQAVPRFTASNPSAEKIVQALIHKGPYVRFAWGLASDDRLNHHPEPPPNIDQKLWLGRRFSDPQAELFIRVERQCIWGLADAGSALFTIRTYLSSLSSICDDKKYSAALRNAINSMSVNELAYKEISGSAIHKILRT